MLREIAASHAQNSASGTLDEPFQLRITRRGIKVDETISPRAESSLSYWYLPAGALTTLEPRLKKWHKNAKMSGYGDVREQVTKVDKNVRQAKEIPASEFSVDPELLERIADLWDQNFFPNSGVRVEPYKIHLYVPGDHLSIAILHNRVLSARFSLGSVIRAAMAASRLMANGTLLTRVTGAHSIQTCRTRSRRSMGTEQPSPSNCSALRRRTTQMQRRLTRLWPSGSRCLSWSGGWRHRFESSCSANTASARPLQRLRRGPRQRGARVGRRRSQTSPDRPPVVRQLG